MNYVTVEVEIDHGRVTAQGPESLPEKASGLLTIFSAAPRPSLLPLTAWETLQKQLQLDAGGAASWLAATREARR